MPYRPPPSSILPGVPIYRFEEHRARVEKLWENYPLRTDDGMARHLYGIFNTMRDRLSSTTSEDVLATIVEEVISRLLIRNRIYCRELPFATTPEEADASRTANVSAMG